MSDLLRADGVSFRYPQNQRGFGPVLLRVQAGESILVSGVSGSGKCTLARCLTGIIPYLYHGDFQGKVWLDGLRTDESPLWALAMVRHLADLRDSGASLLLLGALTLKALRRAGYFAYLAEKR